MKQKEVTELTHRESLVKAKKTKLNSITNAVFIGMMIGIIIFSIIKNSFGFFTLIPLFFIYKAIENSRENKALEKHLKEETCDKND